MDHALGVLEVRAAAGDAGKARADVAVADAPAARVVGARLFAAGAGCLAQLREARPLGGRQRGGRDRPARRAACYRRPIRWAPAPAPPRHAREPCRCRRSARRSPRACASGARRVGRVWLRRGSTFAPLREAAGRAPGAGPGAQEGEERRNAEQSQRGCAQCSHVVCLLLVAQLWTQGSDKAVGRFRDSRGKRSHAIVGTGLRTGAQKNDGVSHACTRSARHPDHRVIARPNRTTGGARARHGIFTARRSCCRPARTRCRAERACGRSTGARRRR